jgi:Mce-associated membrane protein
MDTEQEQSKQRSNVPVLVATALVVAAVAFAGWSGVSWYSAANDETLQFATARDDVLRIGQQELVNFYSLDYKNPDKSFDQMLNQATGPLADTLKQNKDSWRKQIQDGKASLSVKVLDAAVSDLDNRAGSASMTAMLEFVTTPDQGQPVSSRVPMQSALARTDAGWKLSQAARIPLGAQN